MKKVALIIDHELCWGCKACEVACKQENDAPDGIKHIFITEQWQRQRDDQLNFLFHVNRCRHCDDPPCATACPEGAITKDLQMGIVSNDSNQCNGCSLTEEGGTGDKSRGTSPCKVECPAHINVQGYVNLAAKGKFHEALQLIKETNPFPSISGRICHHPCESGCNRGQIDEPVANHAIERFIGDLDINGGDRFIPRLKEKKQDKVAVIGSGPAGLTCAYYLTQEGYPVTVFEKAPVLGGMLTMGIPSYRLPKEIVDSEIRHLSDMGVIMKTQVELGKDTTIELLREAGYKAFFLAVGTQECVNLGIEGEGLKGVYNGLDYLRRINRGESISMGKTVAVIGGGNAAMDVVRSARRQGAENACVLYRRTMAEMPANKEEIEECQAEGIPIHTQVQPVKFRGENGRVKDIECVKMTLTDLDESGRRRPEPVPGSTFSMEVDAVITALGQEADWGCLTPDCACTLTQWGTLSVDSVTLQSDDSDIFAGGDAVRGPRSVIEAIADGKRAAVSIDRHLRGQDLRSGRGRTWCAIDDFQKAHYDPAARISMPTQAPEVRVTNFGEVQKGLTEQMAVQEAQRCVSCGSCCVQACPFDVMQFNPETGKAIKCHLCRHRVEKGLLPACADNVCLAHCIYFGNPDDVQKTMKDNRKRRLIGERGGDNVLG